MGTGLSPVCPVLSCPVLPCPVLSCPDGRCCCGRFSEPSARTRWFVIQRAVLCLGGVSWRRPAGASWRAAPLMGRSRRSLAKAGHAASLHASESERQSRRWHSPARRVSCESFCGPDTSRCAGSAGSGPVRAVHVSVARSRTETTASDRLRAASPTGVRRGHVTDGRAGAAGELLCGLSNGADCQSRYLPLRGNVRYVMESGVE